MFTLWGRKKTTAQPALASTSVAVAEPPAPVAAIEPELPPLVVVKRDFAKPQRPRPEEEIIVDIDVLSQTIVDATSARDVQVVQIEAEKTDNVERAAKAAAGLLAIEGALKDTINKQRDQAALQLNQRITAANDELAAFAVEQNKKIRTLEIEREVRDLDAQFPRIDMSFLSQLRPLSSTDKLQVPKFGLFTLDSPTCTLTATAHYQNYPPRDNVMGMPVLFAKLANVEKLRAYARDVVENRRRVQRAIITLTATFSGAIPASVRDTLVGAAKNFQCVYLVNEPQWQLDQELVPFPPRVDPLVIGTRHDIYWLIASFDTTPAEEYIRREFTEGRLTDQRA